MDQQEGKKLLKQTAEIFTRLGEKNEFLKQIQLEEYTLTKRDWDGKQIYNLIHEGESIVQFVSDKKTGKIAASCDNHIKLKKYQEFADTQEMTIRVQDNLQAKSQSRPGMRPN